MENLAFEYLLLSHCKLVTVEILKKLLRIRGSLFGLSKLSNLDLKFFGFESDSINTLRNISIQKAVSRELIYAEKSGIYFVLFEDNSYPPLLKEIYDPPFVLSALGDKMALTQKSITIVGARNSCSYGTEMAFKLSYDLAKSGYCVVSGFARGVDISSHQGALKAEGSTIAVLGSGFGNIYPQYHLKYVEKILEKGCLITEYSFNNTVVPENFPKRNRILAGISQGTVVVEASAKSGSLITAKLALQEGRDVFAVPISPMSTNNATNFLIQDGAIITNSCLDILNEYKFY